MFNDLNFYKRRTILVEQILISLTKTLMFQHLECPNSSLFFFRDFQY